MKKRISVITLFIGFFYFSATSAFAQEVLDGVYIKEHTPTRKPIPYTHLREADVMWARRIWREIDLRQKINHPLFFPTEPIPGRKSLFDVIKEGINEGTVTAYEDEEFRKPMTKEEAVIMFSSVDTQYVENPNTGDMEQKIVPKELLSVDIRKYRLKEDWFFDKQKSVMEVRIVGIQVIKQKLDENANFKGLEGMFWVYFPQARFVFANSEVFNRQNDSERRTYEDIFWKRMFGSHIYKETNVYDRMIADYAKGIDVMLEAERIKDDMFNWEHDLWHY